MKWAIVRKAPFHRQKRMHRFRNGKPYQAQYPNALNDSSLIKNPPHTLPAFSLTQRVKAYKILGESAILNISHNLAHTTFRASFRPQALQRRRGTFNGGSTASKVAKTHSLCESYVFPSPNQTITVNEAMTMVCRALGYTNQAKELVGSWPANYIALGQTLGLYDDVNANATTDRASAAQIIYNALDKDLVYINADGDTVRQVVTQGPPPVYNSMLRSLGGNDVGELVLTDTLAKTAVVNVNEHIGEYVNAWVNDDGDIIAIETLSTKLTGDFNATKGEFETDDTVYYLKYENANFGTPANSPLLFENGTANGDISAANATSFSGIAVTGNKNLFDDAMEYDTRTINVKLSGKTIKEVYSVMLWDVTDMDQFESGDLNVAKAKINVNGTDYKFEKDKNGEIDMSSFALVGVSSLEKIADDNVVEVWTEDGTAAKPIVKIAVGTKTVTGEVTEINKDATKITIDGTKYAKAVLFADAIEVGDKGTAYLNADGDIAYWDADEETAGNYGIWIGARVENGTTISSSTTMVGLCLKDGTVKEYETTSSVVGTPTGVTATQKIVTYSFNSSGKINNLKDIPAGAQASFTAATNKVNDAGTRIGNVKFASSLVIFLYDAGEDEWTLGKVSDLDKDVEYGAAPAFLLGTALNDKGELVALAVNKATAVGTDDSYGVINSISKKADDGTTYWYVRGYMDGDILETWTDVAATAAFNVNGSKKGCGIEALYKLSVDSDNHVTVTDATAAGILASRTGILEVKSVDKNINEVTVVGGNVYGLTKDVVVYYYDDDADKYVAGTIANIGKGKSIEFAQVSSDAVSDGLYDYVVVWTED